MQAKVIKAINGLEEGDILNYNEKTHKYEIKKIEEDISDNGYSSKKTLHTYSKDVIKNHNQYFEFIDNNGNKVELKEDSDIWKQTVENIPPSEVKAETKIPTETIEDWKSECIKLHNQIKDLEQQLSDAYYITPKYNNRVRQVYFSPFNPLFLY